MSVVRVTTRSSTATALKVFRCGCGHPEQHNGQGVTCQCGQPTPHASTGPEHVCPHPRLETDLGDVDRSFYGIFGPLKNLWWKLTGRREATKRILDERRAAGGF